MRKLAVKKLTSLNSFSYTGLMSVYEKERGDLLEKAFESILNQTILPAYFVLVRDGILPQRLNDVINAAKNSFIRVGIEFIELTNATNLGLGKSLNKGLKACPTELVARFDSDDVNLHNRMENTLAYFSANSNIAVVGGQISEWDVSPDLSTGIRQVPTSYEAIKNLAQRRNPFNHMSVTFRKSVINSVGSYQNVLLFEDYYLWIRVIQAGYLVINSEKVFVKGHVDSNFLAKRGGLGYFYKEIYFQKLLLKRHFIVKGQFLINVIVRGGSRLVPRKLLSVIYKKLRKV